jgi:hypothetical protein
MTASAAVRTSQRWSAGEREARIDLAACYRLIAQFRMTDLVYTHISARIPGTEHFLLNPTDFCSRRLPPRTSCASISTGTSWKIPHTRSIRGLHHPQRDSPRAVRCKLRSAHPYASRHRDFGAARGAAADIADRAAVLQPARLPRLRRHRPRSRRARPAGARSR